MFCEHRADTLARPREVLVCLLRNSFRNLFCRSRHADEFAMKRIVAVKLRDRQIKHVLVKVPRPPLALRLKLFNTGS